VRTKNIYGVFVKVRDGVTIKTIKEEIYGIWHTVMMPTDRLAHKLNVHYETAEVIQNLLLEHDKGTFVDKREVQQ
jgi:hypothetical protein